MTDKIADYVKGKIVEPVQGIDFSISLASRLCLGGQSIPLPEQYLKIRTNVRLKLVHVLGTESVRDGFPLPCMFDSVSCIEEPSLDTDKGIVVIAITFSVKAFVFILLLPTSSEIHFRVHR